MTMYQNLWIDVTAFESNTVQFEQVDRILH